MGRPGGPLRDLAGLTRRRSAELLRVPAGSPGGHLSSRRALSLFANLISGPKLERHEDGRRELEGGESNRPKGGERSGGDKLILISAAISSLHLQPEPDRSSSDDGGDGDGNRLQDVDRASGWRMFVAGSARLERRLETTARGGYTIQQVALEGLIWPSSPLLVELECSLPPVALAASDSPPRIRAQSESRQGFPVRHL